LLRRLHQRIGTAPHQSFGGQRQLWAQRKRIAQFGIDKFDCAHEWQPHQFIAKQNNKVVIALRQVRVDWHFLLFWPSRNLRAEGFCGDASFGRPFEPAFPGEILSHIGRL
jgi:hypothetical protein